MCNVDKSYIKICLSNKTICPIHVLCIIYITPVSRNCHKTKFLSTWYFPIYSYNPKYISESNIYQRNKLL